MQEHTISERELEEIMDRYGEMVYRLAHAQTHSRQDADDIYQEVFLRYFQKAPAFASEEHRKAWLLRVTVNQAKKLFRSPWRRRTVPLEDAPDGVALTQEEYDLNRALAKLPLKYRQVIHLYYFEDFSVEEIAQLLRRKNATVRSQLHRGREQLRAILEKEELTSC